MAANFVSYNFKVIRARNYNVCDMVTLNFVSYNSKVIRARAAYLLT